MRIKLDRNSLSNVNESLSVHYMIYEIVNDLNGMHYIGQHKTARPLDSYSGSGDYLKSAEAKYGLSNFTKSILYDFDNFDDMNEKEKELVQLSNCFPYDETSYNIREGGSHGQFTEESIQKMVTTRLENQSYVGEKNGMYGQRLSDFMEPEAYDDLIRLHIYQARERAKDPEWLRKMSEVTSGENNGMYGKHLSDLMEPDAYRRMCENENRSHKGEDNPMYGKSSWDKCTPDERADRVARFRASIKGKNKGKKGLVDPVTKKVRYAKPEDVQAFLDAGYVLLSRNKRLVRKGKADEDSQSAL